MNSSLTKLHSRARLQKGQKTVIPHQHGNTKSIEFNRKLDPLSSVKSTKQLPNRKALLPEIIASHKLLSSVTANLDCTDLTPIHVASRCSTQQIKLLICDCVLAWYRIGYLHQPEVAIAATVD